jgi:uncharacterized protein YjbJ (UPF0337 family)
MGIVARQTQAADGQGYSVNQQRQFKLRENNHMNSDIVKGKWNQIKGDVKKSFGKLTDDDMLVLEGDAAKATGLLQERYGYTREEAEKRWNEFTSQVNDSSQTVQNDARTVAGNVKSKV